MYLHENPLRHLLQPKSVAVFGDGAVAQALVANLRAGSLADRIHRIGSGDADAVPTINALGSHVSVALLALPAAQVAAALGDCGRKGVNAAVVYATDTPPGQIGESQLGAIAQAVAKYRMRVLGPRALGFVLPHQGLNLTPVERSVPAGNLAFVSQSSALAAHILDWNHNEEFGFSAIFGPGLGADVDVPEVLDFLATDPRTESILLYLESVRNARRFLSALRAAAATKPVIAFKSGRYAPSAAVAAAHAHTVTDRDEVFDAALRRAGVLRVHSIGDMFSAARALTTPRKPRGNRLAVVSNGGGPAVMALDRIAELGIVEATPSDTALRRLGELHPAPWSPVHPVDMTIEVTPASFVGAVTACAEDPQIDAVLAIYTPSTFGDPLEVAHAIVDAKRNADKPVLSCMLGEVHTQAARAAIAKARYPVFRTPESAVAAFAFMVDWVRNQALLQETPPAVSSYDEPDIRSAQAIIDEALAKGLGQLAPPQAKAVLAAFHIPVTRSIEAATPTDAVAIAGQVGYPVALKSPAGGRIRPALRSAAEVALAFREIADGGEPLYVEPHVDRPRGRWLRISIRPDRVFGPTIALSEAGIAQEIYDARSIALPPLNSRLIGEMLGAPQVARLLGPLPDLPAVAQEPLREILLRTSEIASELPWLNALDITVAAGDRDAIAVEARMTLRSLPAGSDRYAHMAICPYPSDLAAEWVLKDGSRCTIRPIRPGDSLLLQEFVRNLSARSRYLRFFSTMRELPQSSLARYTQLDYGREQMLVAIGDRDGQPIILGEANYGQLPDGRTCEFAVAIADDLAGLGLGAAIMLRLMDAARRQDLKTIRGQVRADNETMLGLMEKLDFVVQLTDDMEVVEVSRPL